MVNLRAGPTEESNIRGTVELDDEVIELTRDRNWIGVRVLQTGEEGWIYGGLLEQVTHEARDISRRVSAFLASSVQVNFGRNEGLYRFALLALRLTETRSPTRCRSVASHYACNALEFCQENAQSPLNRFLPGLRH